MFLGNYEGSLDPKNRVNFPAKLREKIPEAERRSVVLASHPDRCIAIYTLSEWSRITGDFDERSRAGGEWDSSFDRLFYSSAAEVDIDGAGRILIPEKLKRWADLKKAIVFAGVRNRIELWNEERWNAEEEKRSEAFTSFGKGMLR